MVNLLNSINDNTILLVGSTPGYNLGIIDQIPELSKLGFGIWYLSSDACIGSFLVGTDLKYDFSYLVLPVYRQIFINLVKHQKVLLIVYKNKDIGNINIMLMLIGQAEFMPMAGVDVYVVALCWATLMFLVKMDI